MALWGRVGLLSEVIDILGLGIGCNGCTGGIGFIDQAVMVTSVDSGAADEDLQILLPKGSYLKPSLTTGFRTLCLYFFQSLFILLP
jgi:hypothetical protein